MFKRIIDLHLDQWKDDSFRKPIILIDARQVGKTYVEVNFEQLKEAADIFERDLGNSTARHYEVLNCSVTKLLSSR